MGANPEREQERQVGTTLSEMLTSHHEYTPETLDFFIAEHDALAAHTIYGEELFTIFLDIFIVSKTKSSLVPWCLHRQTLGKCSACKTA